MLVNIHAGRTICECGRRPFHKPLTLSAFFGRKMAIVNIKCPCGTLREKLSAISTQLCERRGINPVLLEKTMNCINIQARHIGSMSRARRDRKMKDILTVPFTLK
jgi:hypothetical protein